jgi:hypothetical protein
MTQLDLFGSDFPAIEPQAPAMPEPYTVGSILYSSWGYEQTNIDFYIVVARKGNWVTIQPMNKVKAYDGHMSGTCTPAEPVEIACTFRRRLRIDERGVCYGCKGKDSFDSLYAWDGMPKYFSEYA